MVVLAVTAALATLPAAALGPATAAPPVAERAERAERPDHPERFLARATQGAAAVERLGDAIDEVAALNGMGARELTRVLRTEEAAWLDSTGRLLYVDPLHEEIAAVGTGDTAEGPYPYEDTFALHSRPGASKTIYLDFDGQYVSGTAFNTDPQWLVPEQTHPAFSLDDDPAFSSTEQDVIQSVWQRVSEDYAPFDVDVTTADPGPSGLLADYNGDPVVGTRALITPSTSASDAICDSQCGGVAFIGSFPYGDATYQPAWVFPHLLSNNTKAIAEAVSHEVGHNLGLRHDGSSTTGYYSGHGSWAPIMGNSYNRPISQWSIGEYSGANNAEDDLATIVANGLPPVPDDHGGSVADATVVTSTDRTATGLVGTATDRDVFAFDQSCTGPVTVSVSPAPASPNLDVQLRLIAADGTVVATGNPTSGTQSYDLATGMGADAEVSVTAGSTLYAEVDGTGAGNPFSSGYSDYASLGSYTITSTGCAADAPGVVAFQDAARSVGEGAGTVQLVVTRTGNTSGTATVAYAHTGGTASPGSDFTLDAGTVSFAAGETSKQVPVTILDDSTDEPDEVLEISLSDPSSGTTLGTATTTTLTLTDDDEPPAPAVVAFERTAQSAGEGAGTVQLTVVRSGNTTISSTVGHARTGGSATPGGDFTLSSGTLTFAPGETEKTIDVTVVDDAVTEFDEQVTVALGSPSSGTVLGADASSTLTIIDDDAPAVVTFEKAALSAGEAAGTIDLVVTRTGSTARSSTVDYVRSSGSAASGDDFTLTPGTLGFAAGETEKTITISVTDDHYPEPVETVVISLTSPSTGTVLGEVNSATLTIDDDDAPAEVGFAAKTLTVQEDAGVVELTVTRTGNTRIPATVSYERTGGTTSAVTDALLEAGSVSFAPTETSKTILLTVVDDVQAEGDETVLLSLGSPSAGAVMAASDATVTIRTSDQQPDAAIRTSRQGGYVGDDVYGTLPGEQTSGLPIRRGAQRSFFVRVANDGSTRSSFTLWGTESRKGVKVTYAGKGWDLTSIASGLGAQVQLSPGQVMVVRADVVVTRRAKVGTIRPVMVAATWEGDGILVDVVQATVKVKR